MTLYPGDYAWVEVIDQGGIWTADEFDDEHGRGLAIVATIAGDANWESTAMTPVAWRGSGSTGSPAPSRVKIHRHTAAGLSTTSSMGSQDRSSLGTVRACGGTRALQLGEPASVSRSAPLSALPQIASARSVWEVP
jgi:hypothetical protein